MNKEKFLKRMGEISPEFVEEAAPKRKKNVLAAIASAAAALLLLVGIGAVIMTALKKQDGGSSVKEGAVSSEISPDDMEKDTYPGTEADGIAHEGSEAATGEAKYQEIAAGGIIPLSDMERRQNADKVGSIETFTAGLMNELLGENDGNVVWSPVSVYAALGMLGETAGGASLDEILGVLGEESLTAVRENASALLRAETVKKEHTEGFFSSSLWLKAGLPFDAAVLERLADIYGAASYWGDPSDEAFIAVLRNWLKSATGGLLNVDNVELDPDTVLAMFTTAYFKSQWRAPFNEERTETSVFHSPEGDIECDFMHRFEASRFVCEGDGFIAVCEPVEGWEVWYMLPDEGASIADMLENGGYSFMFSNRNELENVLVNLSVPKLDISCDTDLIPALEDLGMRSCFDPMLASFEGVTDFNLYVTKAAHSARLVTDEEGVEAAAYTQIELAPTSGRPPERVIDIILDRPFVVFVTGQTGQPLFIGAVRSPID